MTRTLLKLGWRRWATGRWACCAASGMFLILQMRPASLLQPAGFFVAAFALLDFDSAFAADTPWKYMYNSEKGAKYMKPSTLTLYPDGSGGNVEVMYNLFNIETMGPPGKQSAVRSIIVQEHFNCQDLSIVRSNIRGYSGDMGT